MLPERIRQCRGRWGGYTASPAFQHPSKRLDVLLTPCTSSKILAFPTGGTKRRDRGKRLGRNAPPPSRPLDHVAS